jgi:cytochrome c biogenesis protein CcdA
VTPALLVGIAGLAVVDSFNPATLVAVTLILFGSRTRPVPEALGFVLGAFVSVLAVGLAIYLGAEAAAEYIDGGLRWLRRFAFGLAALVLLVSAMRALRRWRRTALGLPTWFNPLTAVGLGVVMTGADLPNAFPLFIAIERLVEAGTSTATATLVLVAYGAIYCLPCLVLLAIGLHGGQRVQRLLRRLHDRFGTAADVPASRRRAAAYFVAALLVATVAVTA